LDIWKYNSKNILQHLQFSSNKSGGLRLFDLN